MDDFFFLIRFYRLSRFSIKRVSFIMPKLDTPADLQIFALKNANLKMRCYQGCFVIPQSNLSIRRCQVSQNFDVIS